MGFIRLFSYDRCLFYRAANCVMITLNPMVFVEMTRKEVYI
jgi:hypothetical protein